ncbi:MAG TPA: aminotransferase class III-fold pyridoxal phosphate-dependent enzyme [Bryobacteraceae bacterium]|nr:aminotransferase class III-fold pyridoxal phosphate-dependent enzyme [Bryobacteraceae bacterium]
MTSLPSIQQQGAYFRMRLTELTKKHPIIKEVRGEGLMVGVELGETCKHLVQQAMQEGLLMNVTHDVVMRFLPPYVVREREIDKAVAIVAKLLKNFKPVQQQAQ